MYGRGISTAYLNNRNLNNVRFEKVFLPRSVGDRSGSFGFDVTYEGVSAAKLGSATPRVAVEAAVVVGPTATVAWTVHCCSAWIASVTFVLLYWSLSTPLYGEYACRLTHRCRRSSSLTGTAWFSFIYRSDTIERERERERGGIS